MHTGARPSEILAVTKQDLHPDTQTVFIYGLKRSRDRDLPLPEWLFKHLTQASAHLNPKDKIFPLALRTLQTAWHKYRPAEKGIKSLRHTFAVRLYQKTKDIKLVQLALGHTTLVNTSIYADFVYSQEEMKRIIF